MGIGTATPSAQLHISNTAFDDAPNVLASIDNTSYLITSGSGGHGSIVSYDQYAAYALMVRRIYTTQQSGGFPSSPTTLYDMVVDSNGHVGVGTSSPSTILDVFGPDSTTSLLKVASSSGTAMYITHSGKVGIGTTTPSQALQVSGTAVATHLQMTSGAANGYILKSDSDGNGSWVDPATVGGLWVASGTDIHNTNSGVVKTGGDLRVGTVSHTGFLEINATAQGAYAYANLVKATDSNLKALAVQLDSSDKFVVFGNGKTVTTDLQVTDGGAAGYVMQSDASGNASWVNPASLSSSFWAASGSDIKNTNSGKVWVKGKMKIGDSTTVTPKGYSLYVDSGIITEKVKVALIAGGNWSDYVFDKDYKLPKLEEVQSYISANHHLPDVPSAYEVKRDGIDVGSMDATLLRKIEELTLYVLELKKENKEIKKHLTRR